MLDHEPLERGEPAIVVRRAGACPDLGDQALLELSPRDPKALDDAERHAERSSLPRRFEDELAVAARKGRRARHLRDLGGGTSLDRHGRAVPIIASRVRRDASASASSPSVPAGRSGRTR